MKRNTSDLGVAVQRELEIWPTAETDGFASTISLRICSTCLAHLLASLHPQHHHHPSLADIRSVPRANLHPSCHDMQCRPRCQ